MVPVWDIFVRVFHWSVVIAFLIAYVTEDEAMTLHLVAGYLIGALVVMRVLWGLVGPRHARFVDFVHGPLTVYRYLGDLFALRAKRYLGHNPAGGAMVLALLVGLAAIVWTGHLAYFGGGDLGRRFWRGLHEALANIAVLLVILHIVGIVLASLTHRENLIRAMVTGRKRADPDPRR